MRAALCFQTENAADYYKIYPVLKFRYTAAKIFF